MLEEDLTYLAKAVESIDEYLQQIDPARQQAVTELIGIIKGRYPTATYEVGPGEDDPNVTHITATVDIDDPDEVVDLVIDRMLELQLDHDIPVYVIPIRTPERAAALLRHRRGSARSAILSSPSQPA